MARLIGWRGGSDDRLWITLERLPFRPVERRTTRNRDWSSLCVVEEQWTFFVVFFSYFLVILLTFAVFSMEFHFHWLECVFGVLLFERGRFGSGKWITRCDTRYASVETRPPNDSIWSLFTYLLIDCIAGEWPLEFRNWKLLLVRYKRIRLQGHLLGQYHGSRWPVSAPSTRIRGELSHRLLPGGGDPFRCPVLLSGTLTIII